MTHPEASHINSFNSINSINHFKKSFKKFKSTFKKSVKTFPFVKLELFLNHQHVLPIFPVQR